MPYPEIDLSYALRSAASSLSSADVLVEDLRQVERYLRPHIASGAFVSDPLFWGVEGVADPDQLAGDVVDKVADARRRLSELDSILLQIRGALQRLAVVDNPGPDSGEGVSA
ncbi:hypothetical protein [Nocardia sp. NPDC002869]|uniref:hypothetical protein n=1 Tax=Nocardia sp. NPDC002869 TaxID=3161032 RepID=UPI00398D2310